MASAGEDTERVGFLPRFQIESEPLRMIEDEEPLFPYKAGVRRMQHEVHILLLP